MSLDQTVKSGIVVLFLLKAFNIYGKEWKLAQNVDVMQLRRNFSIDPLGERLCGWVWGTEYIKFKHTAIEVNSSYNTPVIENSEPSANWASYIINHWKIFTPWIFFWWNFFSGVGFVHINVQKKPSMKKLTSLIAKKIKG